MKEIYRDQDEIIERVKSLHTKFRRELQELELVRNGLECDLMFRLRPDDDKTSSEWLEAVSKGIDGNTASAIALERSRIRHGFKNMTAAEFETELRRLKEETKHLKDAMFENNRDEVIELLSQLSGVCFHLMFNRLMDDVISRPRE